MLVSMSDLACCDLGEVIVTKPTIDARTDPTRPPTAVIDTATGLVTPIPATAKVTVIEPEPWWKTAAVLGGAILAFGAAMWLLRRMLPPVDDDLGDTVIVRRRRRPTVIYEDAPAPIFLPSRSEPTVIIEEPPNVLVNPQQSKTFSEGRVTHFEALLKKALKGTGAKVKIKYPRHGDVNVPYVEVTNIDYDAIAADMDLLLELNKLVRSFNVDYDLTKTGVVIGRPAQSNPKRRSKKTAKKSGKPGRRTKSSKHNEEVLARRGLPLPYEGAVVSKLSCQMGTDDWYALTDKGWYWHSGRAGWKFCPQGPLHLPRP